MSRRLGLAGCGLLVALLSPVLLASVVAAADAKRVLVVHSFGSTAPPFTTHSTAFETALTEQLGGRVDLDEVSLDMARYAQPDMEEPFVEFLLKRLAKWQPDLVVPIGSPAGRFVARNRHRLFPHTPVIYTGMDKRTLSPDALRANATFVGEDFDLAGLVEDILLLKPDTSNIVVVLGASPLERYWTIQLRREFERFAGRVSFTWVNDLSFDEMLDRFSRLPPNSFILLALLLRDALGVTHNEDEALGRIHAVANAPINGLYENQLGLGIVGGRLYQAALQGVEAARIAIRILQGEPVSSFPPLVIGTQPQPRYDWRELQRWGISESRLPPGSVVAFRQPTVWARYRWWILGAAGIALLEGALIVQLIVSLARRRRVERALRESEDRLNLAAESAGAGLWSLELDTHRIWATPRSKEQFQLGSEESLTYDKFLGAIHPQDRERVRESFEHATLNGPELALEFRVVGADGRPRWIGTRGHLSGHGNARRTRWSGTSVDITETKLADERLRESEARFRTVADSAPVLIWMAGVDGRCTFVNKPWLDFTGRTAEQEAGFGWSEGVHPDDSANCLRAYHKAFETRTPFVSHYRLRRHDGVYRWIADNGVPRYDAQGVFTGFIGSCSDITERLRAEERFRQVFEAAPSAMIIADDDGKIVLVNAQVERVFGYRCEELTGLTIETLIPERFRREHPGSRREFARDPRPRSMGMGRILFARRKDGSEVPVEISLNPIFTVEGAFVVASVIDVSERQKAETEAQGLRRELTYMSRVATMGELTAAIVHELAQPLTAVLANAQAGLRILARGDLDEVREILEEIVAADQRADQVIRNLRALFKRGDPERRAVVLDTLINDVVSVVVYDATLRNVSIVLDLAPGLPPVLGDRVQLQQVLMNLAVNAFDAMADVVDRSRTLTVRTRMLDGRRVQVDVADTGRGIPPHLLDSIFKPFVTTKREGMGMGLSVSHSIVNAHEGRLWVENAPDGGAIFHIVLPVIADSVPAT